MKKVCAWCGESLNDDKAVDAAEISHGICPACLQKNFAKVDSKRVNDFFDALTPPVLVVDGDENILCGNKAAFEKLGKPSGKLKWTSCGEFISCINVVVPEDCGTTDQCAECGIRKAIIETFELGEKMEEVRVSRFVNTLDGPAKTIFFISTEKAGGIVFLRLNKVEREDAA